MNGGVGGNKVSNLNFNIVTFMNSNGWPRILPIYCKKLLCMAQSGYLLPLNLKKRKKKEKERKRKEEEASHTHPSNW